MGRRIKIALFYEACFWFYRDEYTLSNHFAQRAMFGNWLLQQKDLSFRFNPHSKIDWFMRGVLTRIVHPLMIWVDKRPRKRGVYAVGKTWEWKVYIFLRTILRILDPHKYFYSV